jgi:Ricin-type beta-trefoil lectin domain
VTSASGASTSVARTTAAAAAKQPKQVEVYATYCGWYDNTPPGCATAYSGCARGNGTYAHPITFASDKKEFPVGTILYYPTAEKYVRMGDDCQECDEDWSGNTNHCFGGATTATTNGRYQNAKSGTCLTDDSTRPGTPAKLAPCATSAAEKLAFDGAFFVRGKLCLQTQTGKIGSAIKFATCNGNDREQWEINPNGTIAWIQFARCIADVSGKVELARCTSRASDRSTFTSEAAS